MSGVRNNSTSYLLFLSQTTGGLANFLKESFLLASGGSKMLLVCFLGEFTSVWLTLRDIFLTFPCRCFGNTGTSNNNPTVSNDDHGS